MKTLLAILLFSACATAQESAIVTFYTGQGNRIKALYGVGGRKTSALGGRNLYDGKQKLVDFRGKDHRYASFRFAPGIHYFSEGKPNRQPPRGMELTLESGKHYYILLQTYAKGFYFNAFHVEIAQQNCEEAISATVGFKRMEEKHVKLRSAFERNGGLPECKGQTIQASESTH